MRHLIVILGIFALIACWFSWREYDGAKEQLATLQTQLATMERDVREIVQLRGREQRIAERKPPERDLIARLSDALSRAGLSANALDSIAPESDVELPGTTGFRRQSVRVALRAIELNHFGAFLNVWNESQLVWTVTRIELKHSRQRNCETCYDATLVLSAIYVRGADA
jgi:hypothetical protein